MLYQDFSEVQQKHRGAALAIGNFDGLHIGHRELIKNAVLCADELGIVSGVMTFHPHPAVILGKKPSHKMLMSLEQRVEGILALGVDFVVVQSFSLEFASIEAEEFVREILVHHMDVRHVFIGYNFHFGCRGIGDSALLYRLGAQYGFISTQINEICHNGGAVSSSLIRGQVVHED
jgi:riboflavin kinase/FMN adenylyltransferase